MYKPEIENDSEHMHLLTYSFHFGSKFIATGSLSLSAKNLETGISAPHQQIYHVTNRHGHVANSQWSYRFVFMHINPHSSVIHKANLKKLLVCCLPTQKIRVGSVGRLFFFFSYSRSGSVGRFFFYIYIDLCMASTES